MPDDHQPSVRADGGGMEVVCSCGDWAAWVAASGRTGRTAALAEHATHLEPQ